MSNPKKMFRKTLSTQLAEMLETAIQEEEWKVGEKMPSEPELAEMYGVSRNTVREAVHYLAISGLIEVRQGDGTYVRNKTALDATLAKRLEKEEVKHIMEVRQLIEPAVSAMAAERKTPDESRRLAELHDLMLKSFQEKRQDYLERDAAFHVQIGIMSHNPLLCDLYKAIISRYPEVFKKGFLSFMENDDLEIYLHRDLLDAIIEGDAAAARELTVRMLEHEAKDFLEAEAIRRP